MPVISVRIEVHITGPSNGEFVTMTFPLGGEKFADWAGRAEHRGDLMMACHRAGLVARDELWQEAASARDATGRPLPDPAWEPLGADFAAVWDAHAAELYEPSEQDDDHG